MRKAQHILQNNSFFSHIDINKIQKLSNPTKEGCTVNIPISILKGTLVRGTLFLTIAGAITRIIGFFYRIFLADRLGESLLGIYQLIFSVYGICFTIYGAGIQTAVSQMIASNQETKESRTRTNRNILLSGLCLSLVLSLTLCILVFLLAEPISCYFLLEPACEPYLKILCLLFPFCGVSAAIHGYFYGKKQAKVPAVSQILEQLTRVGSVVCLCTILHASGETGCQIAVFGVVLGEALSCVYNLIRCLKEFSPISHTPHKNKGIFSSLLFLSGTLTATKLVLALLHSVEAVFIPAALKQYGYQSTEALALFGIFSGIALPFILFPSTVTNSFAVMLLPSIAEAHAKGDRKRIRNYVTTSGKYSLLLGYFFAIVFLLFGNFCGTVLFHSAEAGNFITMLSFICPFLYLSTTLTSIINGLGKTQLTFFITLLGLGIKILVLIFLVPLYGIQAYLTGMLISQILMTSWEWYYLRNHMELSTKTYLLYPMLLLLLLGYFR